MATGLGLADDSGSGTRIMARQPGWPLLSGAVTAVASGHRPNRPISDLIKTKTTTTEVSDRSRDRDVALAAVVVVVDRTMLLSTAYLFVLIVAHADAVWW